MNEDPNIDPVEIKKFEDLASRWWDKQGEFKPLHEMNPLRLNFINNGSPLAGKNVCDVGCGGGILVEVANRVLTTDFPELRDRISLQLPDEKSRRVGQAIAAASLPAIK